MTKPLNSEGGLEFDSTLHEVLIDAAREWPSDISWPSDTIVHAYVTGNCTPQQHDIIMFTLTQSSEFRRYMVDVSESIAALESESVRAQFDHDLLDAKPLWSKPQRLPLSRTDQFWGWMRTWMAPRFAAPLLAALAIILLFTTAYQPDDTRDRVLQFSQDTELRRDEFMQFIPRSGDGSQDRDAPAMTAKQAAVTALQECVLYDIKTDSFTLIPGARLKGTRGDNREIRIQIESGKSGSPAIIRSFIPTNAAGRHVPVRAWLMIPPSLKLWRLDVNNDVASIAWPGDTTRPGCITFTYYFDGHYYATPGQVIGD